MNYLKVQAQLAKYKKLSNYPGTVVAAALYDVNDKELTHNYCWDYGNGTSNKYVLHAEPRVILQAASMKLLPKAYTLAVSHSPCLECAKLIVATPIKRIVVFERFLTSWKQSQLEGIELLRQYDKEYINLYLNQLEIK